MILKEANLIIENDNNEQEIKRVMDSFDVTVVNSVLLDLNITENFTLPALSDIVEMFNGFLNDDTRVAVKTTINDELSQSFVTVKFSDKQDEFDDVK